MPKHKLANEKLRHQDRTKHSDRGINKNRGRDMDNREARAKEPAG